MKVTFRLVLLGWMVHLGRAGYSKIEYRILLKYLAEARRLL